MDSESGFIGFVQGEFLTEKEPPLAQEVETAAEDAFIDFDIKMDSIPEGYTYTTEESGGNVYATFTPEDPAAVSVYASISYSQVFAGYTLTADLSQEELDAAKAVLVADYNEPTVTLGETEYGTALFTVTEGDAQTAYADMIMVWHGYVIRISLQKDSELTDADMELVRKIASDMWVVEE